MLSTDELRRMYQARLDEDEALRAENMRARKYYKDKPVSALLAGICLQAIRDYQCAVKILAEDIENKTYKSEKARYKAECAYRNALKNKRECEQFFEDNIFQHFLNFRMSKEEIIERIMSIDMTATDYQLNNQLIDKKRVKVREDGKRRTKLKEVNEKIRREKEKEENKNDSENGRDRDRSGLGKSAQADGKTEDI